MIEGIIFDLNGVLVREDSEPEVVQRVIDVLKFIGEKYKIAVATNRSRRTAIPLLKQSGVLEFFDEENILTRTEAGIKKPHPRVYSMAASSLGLSTKNCLAIDNKGKGCMSALESGCSIWWLKDFDLLTVENLKVKLENPKYPGGIL